MGRLLILAAFILLALAVFFIVRAVRTSKDRKLGDRGYYVLQFERTNGTMVTICKNGKAIRDEGFVSYDEPNRSERLIEVVTAASIKAEDWNLTDTALDYV